MKAYKNVDVYIKAATKETQNVLKEVRLIVKSACPQAVETIAYGMPAYSWKDKPLFYFAAMKSHLGLYPTPGPIQTLAKILKDFSTSKGCVRIPYTAKLPKTIISKLIKERMKEIKTQ